MFWGEVASSVNRNQCRHLVLNWAQFSFWLLSFFFSFSLYGCLCLILCYLFYVFYVIRLYLITVITGQFSVLCVDPVSSVLPLSPVPVFVISSGVFGFVHWFLVSLLPRLISLALIVFRTESFKVSGSCSLIRWVILCAATSAFLSSFHNKV